MLAYVCMLTRGVHYEPLKGLSHSEVRRALSRCICRSGVIPTKGRNDQGPEIWNTLVRELWGLLQTCPP